MIKYKFLQLIYTAILMTENINLKAKKYDITDIYYI